MNEMKILKKIQKKYEPIFLKILKNEGIIQPGETIKFEWKAPTSVEDE